MHSTTEADDERMLTPAQTMERLAISRRTLERYVERQQLKPRYLPSGHRRFDAAEVRALLSGRAA